MKGEVYCFTKLEDAVREAEFIFECVTEDIVAKQNIFKRIIYTTIHINLFFNHFICFIHRNIGVFFWQCNYSHEFYAIIHRSDHREYKLQRCLSFTNESLNHNFMFVSRLKALFRRSLLISGLFCTRSWTLALKNLYITSDIRKRFDFRYIYPRSII